MAGFTPGQFIKLSDGRQARIRFVGPTSFAPGEWVGVELEDPSGKNNGSVQGEAYFECEQGHGMFVRAAVIAAVIEPPKRDEVRVKSRVGVNKADPRGRPSSSIAMGSTAGTKRQGTLPSLNVKRGNSNASSPSPAPKAGSMGRSLRSPTKSPVKQLMSTTPTSSRSSASLSKNSTTTTRPRQSLTNRSSMPPPTSSTPSTRLSRQSMSGSTTKPSKPVLQPSRSTTTSTGQRRPSIRPSSTKPAGTDGARSSVSERSEGSPHSGTPPAVSELEVTEEHPPQRLAPSQPRRSTSGNNLVQKELEDMKTKLRVVEKKRAEDREKLKMVETYRADRDKFEGIIQKLQTKYQPQQQEIAALRKQLKEAEARVEDVERLKAEHDSILEMTALDREMAEEVAESVRAECEALKIKSEELELEVEVLREENQELGEVMSPEEKSSQGWLQMERTNERLREALIRLRDMTQQQEADLKSQVKELEEEMEEYSIMKVHYETVKEQLLISESNMEDLKQQVEALGAEEMIEELTEKNMMYQEEVGELKAVIEDLENLKELNDELEINHIEAEKQLQDEIDYRESVHHEQNRKMAQQDEVIEDLEYTLSRFRELVSNLQNHLEDMRVSQQISETEASDLTHRSRAMIDLNMKLQASAVKTQVKTIDLEINRMESEESAQHLSIMKLYLPEYFESERNPILALLRFKRVGFKALLMSNTVRERLSDSSVSSEHDFVAYDVLEKLTWMSLLCDRFVSFISGCSGEEFSAFEGALYELEPVERILSFWIESLKKSELNENKCADELQRSVALLSHLAETLIPQHVEGYANEVHMRSVLTQTYLENIASTLSQLKAKLQAKIPMEEDDEEGPFLFNKIDTLSHQSRGSKVAMGKVTRSLEELKSRFLALSGTSGEAFEKAEQAAKELSETVRLIGDNIMQLIGEEGRTEPISYAEVVANMSQTVASVLQPSSAEFEGSDALSFLGNKLHTFGGYLEETSSLSLDLSQTVEFERRPSPWVARAKELRSNQASSPDTEEENRRLKNEINEASTAMGIKDKVFEEQAIKIELLESRMRDAGKKAAIVKDLQSELESHQAKERQFVEVLEKQARDFESVERERDEYRARLEKLKRASVPDGDASAAGGVMPTNAAASLAVMKENELLRDEVASLQASVRFLRDDNKRGHLLDPCSVQRTNHMSAWLDVPLVRPKVPVDDERNDRRQTSECHDVLNYLLRLTKESKYVDLKTTLPTEPANRLTWRPVKSTSRYHVLKQREQYEQWGQWKDDVLRFERERGRRDARKAKSNNVQTPLGNFSSTRHATSNPTATEANPKELPSKSGVMGRAWKILGMQTSDQEDIPYESSNDVHIANQE